MPYHHLIDDMIHYYPYKYERNMVEIHFNGLIILNNADCKLINCLLGAASVKQKTILVPEKSIYQFTYLFYHI